MDRAIGTVLQNAVRRLTTAIVVVGPGRADILWIRPDERTPSCLVPEHLTIAGSFPVMVNGKIDRNPIRRMPVRSSSWAGGGRLSRAGRGEHPVAALWGGLLTSSRSAVTAASSCQG
ncbi:hypothetical protein GCM10022222_84960 [Amycolatopsis ultiminotia]|uniref:Uncharacterized protein n=1 Tax=Amycolatopsis ultiminotia TaxID=543629 RepID=A0ABP6YQL3_9PSEU